MIVVPLPSDEIQTKDGAKFVVASYNNFKPKGPAVFCKPANSEDQTFVTVYFFDIEKINDVRVEFSSSSKVFTAQGRIKRKIHLPQPHDTIYIFDKEGEKDRYDDGKPVKVSGYKLHSKKYGTSKGLLILDEDGNAYMLDEVLNLHREIGSTDFNRKIFMKLYKEYSGHRP